jgi:hypothetical protein
MKKWNYALLFPFPCDDHFKGKKKSCCTNIIVETLVPHCIIHNSMLRDRPVCMYFNHFSILQVPFKMSTLLNFINSHKSRFTVTTTTTTTKISYCSSGTFVNIIYPATT